MHIVVAVTQFLTNNIVQSFVQNRQKSSRHTKKGVHVLATRNFHAPICQPTGKRNISVRQFFPSVRRRKDRLRTERRDFKKQQPTLE